MQPPRFTVFDTPVIRTLLRLVAVAALRLFRWRTTVELPRDPKYLLIVAPHTSYWDFPILLAAAFTHRVRAHWLGKHTLFRGPGGPLFRWLGGIPVDPTRRGEGRVAAVVETFRSWDRLALGIAPEAGLSPVTRWRSGFYHIAVGAGVRIAFVFLDYDSKTAGAAPGIVPTGDMAADYARIRAFYAPMQARHPERFALPEVDG
jgi:1-acyl-sn-glycerol-3-phosphate acyltransferase